MDENVVFQVNNVSKKFCKTLSKSMVYTMKDVLRKIFGLKTHSEKLRKDEFWSVSNVSFQLKKGETLALIGHNGSGKTTLLQILNGIYTPDKGTIKYRGEMGALIGVGAGFHPDLTGSENIYVNGAILGMSKKTIDAKYNEIIEFADIGDFIDTPVKHYSSGMYIRLGFAISYQMEPDILLIDEVLAVGDEKFRAKCYQAINRYKERSAIILVTHDMNMVKKLATKVGVMDHGHLTMFEEDPSLGIKHYLDTMK
ncbi:Vitamin B12 import ATP-binding protein BtuD [Candidatus Lokiarchaeum ossiferum]|uniref:Vitamin B12 import ATP-binding protein BtuD n=1 Tax=Candidatus Lokiarchaeum ossiferum TaxID=2951803 RepID=A0ABY6HX46_9ARCH|nr:Vitamin B12 import ATP-binding protein BtuD [Candidatus Lokiarchaeum sp. B-35]